MTERPTPETDAVWDDTSQNILEHARRLERERNEARVLLAQYIPGDGCECEAHNESECGCGVDWTPKRQKQLEVEVAELREKIKRIQAQLYAAMWIIEKQEQEEKNQPNP